MPTTSTLTNVLNIPPVSTPTGNPWSERWGVETVTGFLATSGSDTLAGQTITLTTQAGLPVVTSQPIVTDAQGGYTATFVMPSQDVTIVASAQDSAGLTVESDATYVSGHVDAALFTSLETDPNSVAGQVFDVYQTVLGRAPDAGGISAFVAAVNGGMSMTTVAEAMLDSTEYTAAHGAASSLSPAAVILEMAQNALGHAPLAADVTQWSGMLTGGASLGAVGASIALSSESIGRNGPAFAASGGFYVPDETDATIARLYYGVLGRGPDSDGLLGLEAYIKAGNPMIDAATEMLSSPEYLNAQSGLSDSQFVEALYNNTLGRASDTGGLQVWTSSLAGNSRAAVALAFAECQEAHAHLAPQVELGFKLG